MKYSYLILIKNYGQISLRIAGTTLITVPKEEV